uniref:Copper transport protein n=1 Tax=Salix viminalis TaxID=40686 RepID=A0A6N2L299_SALVM
MPGMSPPPPPPMNGTTGMHHKMMMHMTFFWGKDTLILFSGWPGSSTGMYVLALVFIFVLAVLVEWLSHCRLVKPGSNNVAAGLIKTLMHAIRVGLAYIGNARRHVLQWWCVYCSRRRTSCRVFVFRKWSFQGYRDATVSQDLRSSSVELLIEKQ